MNEKSIYSSIFKWWTLELEKYFLKWTFECDFDWNRNNSQQLMSEMNSVVQNWYRNSISSKTEKFDFFTLIGNFSHSDHFKLSWLIMPSVFWKFVSLLIRTSWIRIWVVNWPIKLPEYFWFFSVYRKMALFTL